MVQEVCRITDEEKESFRQKSFHRLQRANTFHTTREKWIQARFSSAFAKATSQPYELEQKHASKRISTPYRATGISLRTNRNHIDHSDLYGLSAQQRFKDKESDTSYKGLTDDFVGFLHQTVDAATLRLLSPRFKERDREHSFHSLPVIDQTPSSSVFFHQKPTSPKKKRNHTFTGSTKQSNCSRESTSSRMKTVKFSKTSSDAVKFSNKIRTLRRKLGSQESVIEEVD